MKTRIFWIGLSVAVLLAGHGYAQQRTEFQRQKFDRTRFQKNETGSASDAVSTAVEPPSPAMPATPPSPPPPYSTRPEFVGEGEGSQSSTNNATSNLAENPQLDAIPDKWFRNAKDYPELIRIQKETGACLLVYFRRPGATDSKEKGRVRWFETRIPPDIKWRKAMRNYLKLEVTVPSNPEAETLAKQFKLKSTPAIFVCTPTDSPQWAPIFSFDEKTRDLDLLTTTEILDGIKQRSTPAYQNLY